MDPDNSPTTRSGRRLGIFRPFRRYRSESWRFRSFLLGTIPAAALVGFAGTEPSPVEGATPIAVEASFYGEAFAGRPTASGERFDPNALTAAHRTLPFNSLVKVTNAVTGKSTVVKINDRGPFHGNREIDLSKAAADEVGMLRAGTAKVRLEVLTEA